MKSKFYVRQANDIKSVDLIAKAEDGETIVILSAVGPVVQVRGMLQRTADALNKVIDAYEAGAFYAAEKRAL